MQIKPIPGYPLYFAADNGTIMRLPGAKGKPYKTATKLVLKPQHLQNAGYLQVNIGGKSKTVHRLICEAFHGPPPHKNSQCRHLNGRKTDNRPANLRWGSTKQNYADRLRYSTGLKLNKRRVREIRRLLIEDIPWDQIAHVYRATWDTVRSIAQGLQWRGQGCGITPEFRAWQALNLGRGKEPKRPCKETLARLDRNAGIAE